MEIRVAHATDADACVELVRSMPDYFTESTHEHVRDDVTNHPAWVAEEDGSLIGFLTCPRRFATAAEITWAAVLPEHRGRGVGSALVEHALDSLRGVGVAIVEVKTLDSSATYEPYVPTRAFWEARGFVQIDCIDPLPGWDEGSPAAIYAMALREP